ncbi:hypothetical protein DP73_04635 [Desulfosporosinus sp. HMP52]|uniref:glycosyltransferase n=1 Tax=Desulfosporosinus sp. HMP52 TaxID=1487923 RepID=UPI00051F96CE|nr:glycosyltransferase [Desulfosporosinus sp. HMP52]KGK91255.1 hypothetical protein DP73_04635 [Desulfosporosinus sp. HMP52]
MKVLQVIPTLNLAGAERMCENLSVELTRQGIEVVVVSLFSYHTPISNRLEHEGVKVIFLNKRPGLDLRMIVALTKVMKRERPDVLHTHIHVMQYAVPAAILAGVKKRVHTVHNVADKEATPGKQKFNYFFYHKCNVIPVALSEEIKQTITKRYNVNENDIPVIFNGIDLSKCIIKKSYNASSESFNILNIARLAEQKNHRMLLHVMKELKNQWPSVRLSIIGNGFLKNEIISEINQLNINDMVELLGVKDNVYQYLSQADMFILPSLYEGMPMTLIEAMGSALPIVTTNVGGIPTMIENEKEGLLVNPNGQELLDAILKLKDENSRRTMGQNARNKALKKFSAEQMAKAYINIYR